jgi:BON domain-containing protein
VNSNNWVLFATGAAVGATAMCLFDPGRGGRRRALLRDKVASATHKTGGALDALGRDAYNRARGVVAETWSAVRTDEVTPRKLEDRVRAELGRVVSHPRAIDVTATDDGCVCLCGPVLTAEADAAISAARSVRGVCSVEDQLERHETAEGVSSLQGGRQRPGRRSALLQDSWSPTTKALVCIASTALAAGIGYATMAPGHEEPEYSGA